ncbi:MAG: DUF4254 domain-containing protein [Candidatus Omnitrophica bacterium]|nr:DUF4254 domain-containing protein [Candidatus Omnitrophota bacterium]
MAETLGSLVDKLTIKSIREFHIKKMLKNKNNKFSKKELRQKLAVLRKQKKTLLKEVEIFIGHALSGKIVLQDEKIKLYNDPRDIGKIGKVTTLASAIDGLCRKNMEIWDLEDEARRRDKPLAYIGGVKRKIDLANQKRNDFIDKVDDLLKCKINRAKK